MNDHVALRLPKPALGIPEMIHCANYAQCHYHTVTVALKTISICKKKKKNFTPNPKSLVLNNLTIKSIFIMCTKSAFFAGTN